MSEDELLRIGASSLLVDEVDACSVYGTCIVRKLVAGVLLGAPIEMGPRVVDTFLKVREIGTILPASSLYLIGPACVLQARAEVLRRLLRNLHANGSTCVVLLAAMPCTLLRSVA